MNETTQPKNMDQDSEATPVLSVQNLTKQYGGLVALDGVTFDLYQGELVGLIGPNGAGKSTFFNTVSKTIPLTQGTIEFQGDDITNKEPFEIANRGLSRTFQETRHFNEISAFDNILMGLTKNQMLSFKTLLTSAFGSKREALKDEVHSVADEVSLTSNQLEQTPEELTHLERVQLSIARCLITEPDLLMLDEPFGGLTAEEISTLSTIIQDIHESNKITILIVDHNVKDVIDISTRMAVLIQGRLVQDGKPQEVVQAQKVREAYFGE